MSWLNIESSASSISPLADGWSLEQRPETINVGCPAETVPCTDRVNKFSNNNRLENNLSAVWCSSRHGYAVFEEHAQSVWRDQDTLVTFWFQCAVYKLIFLLTYLRHDDVVNMLTEWQKIRDHNTQDLKDKMRTMWRLVTCHRLSDEPNFNFFILVIWFVKMISTDNIA